MKKMISTLMLLGVSLFAQDSSLVPPSTTVAIMDIQVTGKNYVKTAGDEIETLLSAFLSMAEDVKVIERKKLDELLSEQATSEAGFTDENARIKAQKLYGVEYFVSGKLFGVGSKTYLTVNLVNSETSAKKTLMVKSSLRGNYGDLAEQAGEKLLLTFAELAMIPKPAKEKAPATLIKEATALMKLPRVAIYVSEEHVSQALPDPAAQFELIEIMRKAGLEVIEYKSSIKSDLFEDGVKEITANLKDVDVILLGEGVSEFALRRGELISCKARLELKALRKTDEKILALKSITASGVDVTETIAAKEALQNCSNKLAADFVIEMVKKWNAE